MPKSPYSPFAPSSPPEPTAEAIKDLTKEVTRIGTMIRDTLHSLIDAVNKNTKAKG